MSRMFGRVCDLMRANVLEIITKSEDPEKMLRLYLDDARNHLQESQAAVATAISSEKLLDAQHAEALSAVHTWQSRAEAAVAKDRDDLAREALAEQQKAQARADQLGSALGQAHTVAENARQALLEIEEDIKEGADMIMVKPALPYLDVIRRAREAFNYPLAAYNVSGEYSMVKAASQRGWIDGKTVTLEILTAIKRAGADIIITYHAKEAAAWLQGK